MTKLDLSAIRKAFPGLDQSVNGHPLVYVDSAATAQKPRAVLDAVAHAYTHDTANVHRGVHQLSQRATAGYEGSRQKVATFLGGVDSREVVFTGGATEALNLLAYGIAATLSPGDEVLVTEMEHHANLVPWQLACERTGARLRHIPVTDEGMLDLTTNPFTDRTKVLAIVHASNTLGTINPIAELARMAHERGAIVVVDGAQWAPHGPVSPRELGADAYVLSGHKLFGPTGIGVLWADLALLESLPVWQGGGDMIRSVTLEKSTFAEVPHRFEAGTPPIVQAIGLAAAISWLEEVGWTAIAEHEQSLMAYLADGLASVAGLRRIGVAEARVPLASFVLEGIHPHDIGTILDLDGIALRTGHHCTEPLMERFGVPATARVSLAFYNVHHEIDRVVDALNKAKELFA